MQADSIHTRKRSRASQLVAWASRLVLFVVLVVAGMLKINDPHPAADYVLALMDVDQPNLLRLLGIVEVVLAVCMIVSPRAIWAPRAVLVLFIAFATAHAFAAVQSEPFPPCACMGTSALATRIPEWAWIPGNLALAVLAWRAAPRGGNTHLAASHRGCRGFQGESSHA